MSEPKRPPPPAPKPRAEEETEETAPPGLVEDAPDSDDEARMLEAARQRQRRAHPELVALTEKIAARMKDALPEPGKE